MIAYGLIRRVAPTTTGVQFVSNLAAQHHPEVVFAKAVGSHATARPYVAFVKLNIGSCDEAPTVGSWFSTAGALEWDIVTGSTVGPAAPRIKNPNTSLLGSAVVLVDVGDDPVAFRACADGVNGVYGTATIDVCEGNPPFNVILVVWAPDATGLQGVLDDVKASCDTNNAYTYQPLLYFPSAAASPVLTDENAQPILPPFEIDVSIDGTVVIDNTAEDGAQAKAES
jgi:hypothetical protein